MVINIKKKQELMEPNHSKTFTESYLVGNVVTFAVHRCVKNWVLVKSKGSGLDIAYITDVSFFFSNSSLNLHKLNNLKILPSSVA